MEEEQSKMIPLLKKVYYDDCPGCKIEKRKDTDSRIPWKTLISIWIIVLCIGNLFYYFCFFIPFNFFLFFNLTVD